MISGFREGVNGLRTVMETECQWWSMVGRDEEYENVANGVGVFSSRITLGYLLRAYVNAVVDG